MDWGEDVGRGDGESRTDTKLGDEVGSTLIWDDSELCQITMVPPLALE